MAVRSGPRAGKRTDRGSTGMYDTGGPRVLSGSSTYLRNSGPALSFTSRRSSGGCTDPWLQGASSSASCNGRSRAADAGQAARSRGAVSSETEQFGSGDLFLGLQYRFPGEDAGYGFGSSCDRGSGSLGTKSTAARTSARTSATDLTSSAATWSSVPALRRPSSGDFEGHGSFSSVTHGSNSQMLASAAVDLRRIAATCDSATWLEDLEALTQQLLEEYGGPDANYNAELQKDLFDTSSGGTPSARVWLHGGDSPAVGSAGFADSPAAASVGWDETPGGSASRRLASELARHAVCSPSGSRASLGFRSRTPPGAVAGFAPDASTAPTFSVDLWSGCDGQTSTEDPSAHSNNRHDSPRFAYGSPDEHVRIGSPPAAPRGEMQSFFDGSPASVAYASTDEGSSVPPSPQHPDASAILVPGLAGTFHAEGSGASYPSSVASVDLPSLSAWNSPCAQQQLIAAEDWVASFSPPEVAAACVSYPGAWMDVATAAQSLDAQFFRTAPGRARAIAAVENGALLQDCLAVVRNWDRDAKGRLPWTGGTIRDYVVSIFQQYNMPSPPEGHIYQFYTKFDRDRRLVLEPRDCVCLVDALFRAVLFDASAMAAPQAVRDVSPQDSEHPTVLAERWVSNYEALPVAGTVSVSYSSGVTIYFEDFAPALTGLAVANAPYRGAMIWSIETGDLMRTALRIYMDREGARGEGYLSWETQAIRDYTNAVFQHYGLCPPTGNHIYDVYARFVGDRFGTALNTSECLCFVDAMFRALFHIEVRTHDFGELSSFDSIGFHESRAKDIVEARRAGVIRGENHLVLASVSSAWSSATSSPYVTSICTAAVPPAPHDVADCSAAAQEEEKNDGHPTGIAQQPLPDTHPHSGVKPSDEDVDDDDDDLSCLQAAIQRLHERAAIRAQEQQQEARREHPEERLPKLPTQSSPHAQAVIASQEQTQCLAEWQSHTDSQSQGQREAQAKAQAQSRAHMQLQTQSQAQSVPPGPMQSQVDPQGCPDQQGSWPQAQSEMHFAVSSSQGQSRRRSSCHPQAQPEAQAHLALHGASPSHSPSESPPPSQTHVEQHREMELATHSSPPAPKQSQERGPPHARPEMQGPQPDAPSRASPDSHPKVQPMPQRPQHWPSEVQLPRLHGLPPAQLLTQSLACECQGQLPSQHLQQHPPPPSQSRTTVQLREYSERQLQSQQAQPPTLGAPDTSQARAGLQVAMESEPHPETERQQQLPLFSEQTRPQMPGWEAQPPALPRSQAMALSASQLHWRGQSEPQGPCLHWQAQVLEHQPLPVLAPGETQPVPVAATDDPQVDAADASRVFSQDHGVATADEEHWALEATIARLHAEAQRAQEAFKAENERATRERQDLERVIVELSAAAEHLQDGHQQLAHEAAQEKMDLERRIQELAIVAEQTLADSASGNVEVLRARQEQELLEHTVKELSGAIEKIHFTEQQQKTALEARVSELSAATERMRQAELTAQQDALTERAALQARIAEHGGAASREGVHSKAVADCHNGTEAELTTLEEARHADYAAQLEQALEERRLLEAKIGRMSQMLEEKVTKMSQVASVARALQSEYQESMYEADLEKRALQERIAEMEHIAFDHTDQRHADTTALEARIAELMQTSQELEIQAELAHARADRDRLEFEDNARCEQAAEQSRLESRILALDAATEKLHHERSSALRLHEEDELQKEAAFQRLSEEIDEERRKYEGTLQHSAQEKSALEAKCSELGQVAQMSREAHNVEMSEAMRKHRDLEAQIAELVASFAGVQEQRAQMQSTAKQQAKTQSEALEGVQRNLQEELVEADQARQRARAELEVLKEQVAQEKAMAGQEVLEERAALEAKAQELTSIVESTRQAVARKSLKAENTEAALRNRLQSLENREADQSRSYLEDRARLEEEIATLRADAAAAKLEAEEESAAAEAARHGIERADSLTELASPVSKQDSKHRRRHFEKARLIEQSMATVSGRQPKRESAVAYGRARTMTPDLEARLMEQSMAFGRVRSMTDDSEGTEFDVAISDGSQQVPLFRTGIRSEQAHERSSTMSAVESEAPLLPNDPPEQVSRRSAILPLPRSSRGAGQVRFARSSAEDPAQTPASSTTTAPRSPRQPVRTASADAALRKRMTRGFSVDVTEDLRVLKRMSQAAPQTVVNTVDVQLPAPGTGKAAVVAAEQWVAGHHASTLEGAGVGHYLGDVQVDFADFATKYLRQVSQANNHHRTRIKTAIENGEVLRAAITRFKACDKDLRGALSWGDGSAARFMEGLFGEFGVVAPAEVHMQALFKEFDTGRHGYLDASQCICFADALFRASFIHDATATPPESVVPLGSGSLGEVPTQQVPQGSAVNSLSVLTSGRTVRDAAKLWEKTKVTFHAAAAFAAAGSASPTSSVASAPVGTIVTGRSSSSSSRPKESALQDAMTARRLLEQASASEEAPTPQLEPRKPLTQQDSHDAMTARRSLEQAATATVQVRRLSAELP